ncbi:MAG: antibiotic biosynthesis monooxygenase [Bdellovibrionaceae bacterium]|nr:antibiotic biosynthesis monooxygenase [Pseudobdellovibrionaceae bacterium]
MNITGFEKPYYAVIFSSVRNNTDHDGYEKMAERMVELAQLQAGFLGMESVRGSDGFGITISYWNSPESIKAWKANSEHQIAQEFGRTQWYERFSTRICKVERDYDFSVDSIHRAGR